MYLGPVVAAQQVLDPSPQTRGRQDPVSGAGPEVLFGSNLRPERVSIPPFHLLQERTYLRHQTRYSLFLVETNHSKNQIMQACHWKAHNTFTNFYLKDLTWSDNDNNMYVGPVVAAQQVLDPSP